MGQGKSAKRLSVVLLIVGVGVGLAALAGGASFQWGGISLLLWCALLAFGMQWLAAIPAILLKTEKFYDLIGSLTYILCVSLALWQSVLQAPPTPLKFVTAALVILWALRLGSFLVRRIHKAGKDDRFIKIKQDPMRFLIAWTLQVLWVFLTALSAVIIITTTHYMPDDIHLVTWLGWGLWLAGFAIEIVADAQKSAFNDLEKHPENKGKWVNTGLWAYSQHPNYFGEILLWAGVCVSGMATYQGWQWLALLSPLFVYLLLTKVSGIPLLDQRAKEKWGDDPDYAAYCERTSVLIPMPSDSSR